jgi:tRNA G18 (ribose-2'-O)-methylase SpoU
MPVVTIDDVEDPRVAIYRDLKSAFAQRRQTMLVVEGLVLTERLLASNVATASVLTEGRFLDRLRPLVPPDAPLYVTKRSLVEEIAGFRFHRGVLGCGYRPVSPDLRAVMDSVPPISSTTVCVGIQDPENLGGIIRTSAAFGATAIFVGPGCADPFSRRVTRTSMGANLSVPIIASTDLRADLATLQHEFGVRLVATVLDESAQPLASVAPPQRTALLLGSEGFGLDHEWIEMCDDCVTIPMSQGVDSLNVSVAAGIFLYHFAPASRRMSGED